MAAAAAAVPQQLHVLGGGAVEKKQVYFGYAKVQWESDQVRKQGSPYFAFVHLAAAFYGIQVKQV
jgi:hypothetical protein